MKQGLLKTDFKQEITIAELVELMFSKLVWLIIAGIVAASALGVFTKYMITPKYKTSTTMYLYTSVQASQLGAINNSDLVAASNLAETFKHILTSNQVADSAFELVKEKGGESELTVQKLQSMISVSKIDGTQLIEIDIVGESPEITKLVADSYAEAAAEEFVRITKVGGVEMVEYPELPTAPYSPSLIKNCILGFVAGAAVMALLILVRFMADTTIYTSEEIERISDLPVLGTIPAIDVAENRTAFTWSIKERGVLNASKENQ